MGDIERNASGNGNLGNNSSANQTEENEPLWYVLRVQSGKEDRIERTLNRMKEQHEEIYEIVTPKEKVTEIKAGKREVIDKKIYPGYIFIKMQLNDEIWYQIKMIDGIGDFVGTDKPTPLSETDVNRVFNLVKKASDEQPALNVTFNKGDIVRVKGGPFENFEGTVEEINMKKGTIKVSMVIFGRPTNVELEYWQVEKV